MWLLVLPAFVRCVGKEDNPGNPAGAHVSIGQEEWLAEADSLETQPNKALVQPAARVCCMGCNTRMNSKMPPSRLDVSPGGPARPAAIASASLRQGGTRLQHSASPLRRTMLILAG